MTQHMEHTTEFLVVGAGLSGMAAAITAARLGHEVALVTDRPVPGGNASKEIQVPPVGARCCNFQYSIETGLSEEWLLKNLRRNPTGAGEGWHLTLLDALWREPKVRVFFNTTVDQVEQAADGRVEAVQGQTIGAETHWTFRAPFFADCTGNGTVATLAGAPFRMGVESRDEFGESLADDQEHSHLMGSTIQFRARDTGRPVHFEKPDWVTDEFDEDSLGPHRTLVNGFQHHRGGFWWLEFGSDLDIIHDNEVIRDRLWKIVYALWDYLKNRSDLREKLATWELEWVGTIPGRRESRRVEGDHILTQGDIESQRHFDDAVAYGGWLLDHHYPGGIFAPLPSDNVFLPGPYNIPLRCLYARDIPNLFLAGRDISVSHYALSSTRVMLTCAQTGEAVGAAAGECLESGGTPRDIVNTPTRMRKVQRDLQRFDHYIHGLPADDPDDRATSAVKVEASSSLPGGFWERSHGQTLLDTDRLSMFPVVSDRIDSIEVLLDVESKTELAYAVFQGAENGSTWPAEELRRGKVALSPGKKQWVPLDVSAQTERSGWHFLELAKNPAVSLHYGGGAPVGMLAYTPRAEDPIRKNPYSRWQRFRSVRGHDPWALDHSKPARNGQTPHNGMAADAHCLRVYPEQKVYGVEELTGPWLRPTHLPNLWISQPTDFQGPEWVQLEWDAPVQVEKAVFLFDSSLENHLPPLWGTYDQETVPSLVRDYRALVQSPEGHWETVAEVTGNYLRFREHSFDARLARAFRLEVLATNGLDRAQVFAIRMF